MHCLILPCVQNEVVCKTEHFDTIKLNDPLLKEERHIYSEITVQAVMSSWRNAFE